jgi:hypothetical protein
VPVGAEDKVIEIKLVAKQMHLALTVVDKSSGRAILGAKVEIFNSSSKLTDSTGKCALEINLARVGAKVHATITHPNYQYELREFPLDTSRTEVIELKKK